MPPPPPPAANLPYLIVQAIIACVNVFHGTAFAQHRIFMRHKKNRFDQDDVLTLAQTATGPGRGNAKSGIKKAYIRRRLTHAFYASSFYMYTRQNAVDFQKVTGVQIHEFERILCVAAYEIKAPINARMELTEEENALRVPRKRMMKPDEMLFFWFRFLRAGNEGSLGTRTLGSLFGISHGTVALYIQHVPMAIFKSLKKIPEARVEWLDSEERKVLGKMLYDFDKCFALVDGTKQRRTRPADNQIQDIAYDGHHHTHCYSTLVWVDPLGIYIHLDFSEKGSEHDRSLFGNSRPIRNRSDYFSEEETVMGDTGFIGEGPLVTPSRGGENNNFLYRSIMNRDIRHQRISNEWGVGAISNKWRIFLGQWPVFYELYPICYQSCAMILNWNWRLEGTLVPLDRRLEMVEAYENGLLGGI